jgi:hypothetical protein
MLEEFTDWVMKKSPDESYNMGDSLNCAFAQFLKETGKAVKPVVGVISWNEMGNPAARNPIPSLLHYANSSILFSKTFGELQIKLMRAL